MLDKITEISLLYDFYGSLLTERQKDVMRLHHEEDLSFSEIAERFTISRQGVQDAYKNAEKALNEYEIKLELVNRYEKRLKAISDIKSAIDRIGNDRDIGEPLKKELNEIKIKIDGLE